MSLAKGMRDVGRHDYVSASESFSWCTGRCAAICRALVLIQCGERYLLQAIDIATKALKHEMDCVETDAYVYYVRGMIYGALSKTQQSILYAVSYLLIVLM